jgi:hypothetical protein
MPDINALKEKLKQIEEAVLQKAPEIAITLTLSAKALAERNIKDKGFGYKYSQNKIPAWFLHGKELNQKGTKLQGREPRANPKRNDAKRAKPRSLGNSIKRPIGPNLGAPRACKTRS